MYEDEFKRILDASKNNSLAFFVGAGVSKLSGAAGWSELINMFAEKIGQPSKSDYSYDEALRIPQIFYYSVNKNEDEYYNLVNESLAQPEIKPNVIHRMLLDLNPSTFITTNFDDLIERAAVENCCSFKSVACDNEISDINGDKFILKLHGDLKHRNIVLKEEDYLNYSDTFKLTETLLKSIFATNTVVFIGYGLNDYNIKLILNWTKVLLKEKFNKPIFIHTGKELTDDELKYHESKGISVVDYHNCYAGDCSNLDYIEQYKCVLESINKHSKFTLEEKDDIELFHMLYNILKPLDKLKTLRVQDVRRKLNKYVIIETTGTINLNTKDCNLFKYFLEINSMSNEQKNELPSEIIGEYEVVLSVLSKARITTVHAKEHKYIDILDTDYTFADSNCILFDYCAMHDYVKNKYTDIYDNYKKAYYLAKLQRYEESYKLFTSVAIDAFKKKDYLLTFLAQANRSTVHTSLKCINGYLLYYNRYDLETITNGAFNEERIEHIFEDFPVEFQNQYSGFKNLTSVNMLYENSYYSFVEAQKLQHTIESNTLEAGLTSSDKVICRINNNLHFLLGNGLYMEEFAEFKNTMKNLMSLLIYKYATQNKKSYTDEFRMFSQNKIYFDEIDFYCFIEYFNAKDIRSLFAKHKVETVEFHNIDKINNAILNLIKYYDTVLAKSKSSIEINSLEIKLETCLTLLRYMNISQEIVDKICSFIFKYEFREISIDKKVLFLDAQIHRRKMYSNITAKVIEDKLIYYIDAHINFINGGEKFNLLSATTGINYYSLIHYIVPNRQDLKSRRLSIRVSKIINNSYDSMKEHVLGHYYEYLSANQKGHIIKWLKDGLNNKFSFDDLMFLINSDIRIDKSIVLKLKKYLKNKLQEKNTDGPVHVYPKPDPLYELKNVGYWCFIGRLKKREFKNFIGHCDMFDFFYKYDKFDYGKFDVSWLLSWGNLILEDVLRNNTVKNKIRSSLCDRLKVGDLNNQDEKKLSEILIKYFG